MLEGLRAIDALDRVDMVILGLQEHLEEYGSKLRKSRAKYAFWSQGYMAAKAGVSRRTINRHVRKLRLLGVLSVRQRRKVGGHFQTCLYTITKYAHWGWMKVRKTLTGLTIRETKSSHIVLPSEETPKFPSDSEEVSKVRGLLAGLIRDFEKKR